MTFAAYVLEMDELKKRFTALVQLLYELEYDQAILEAPERFSEETFK